VRKLAAFLVLITPLSCATQSDSPPVLLEKLEPRAERNLQEWCWAHFMESEKGRTIMYFVFNENGKIRYFYHRMMSGKDGANAAISVVLKEDDEEGIRFVSKDSKKFDYESGREIAAKSIVFTLNGKTYRPDQLTFNPVDVNDNSAPWIFEIVNGVDIPADENELLANPRAFLVRQYERNRHRSFMPGPD
jgi:hypothetical protein